MAIGKIIPHGTTFPDGLVEALERQGLPLCPTAVVGAIIDVTNEGGHYVAGKVLSIGFSDTEGVALYITPPKFNGLHITKLAFDENGWYIRPHEIALLKKIPVTIRLF